MNEKQRPRDETPRETEAEDVKTDVTGNSLSRQTRAPQPSGNDPAGSGLADYSAHVVLYQPEIPQNTGNVGRTCVAVGAKLWIVRPAGFRIDDTRIRRAGLDYWEHLSLGDAANWDDLLEQLAPQRLFFFSRFAKRTLWDAKLERGDTFVFGRESAGLPKSILDPEDPRALRLPTSSHVRSLNLGTTVGIVLYEQQRQIRLADADESSGRSSKSKPPGKIDL